MSACYVPVGRQTSTAWTQAAPPECTECYVTHVGTKKAMTDSKREVDCSVTWMDMMMVCDAVYHAKKAYDSND
jgi:hypothetical protein